MQLQIYHKTDMSASSGAKGVCSRCPHVNNEHNTYTCEAKGCKRNLKSAKREVTLAFQVVAMFCARLARIIRALVVWSTYTISSDFSTVGDLRRDLKGITDKSLYVVD